MEDILGLIVEQFVKRARETERARRVAAGAPPTAASPSLSGAGAVSGARFQTASSGPGPAAVAPSTASIAAPPSASGALLRSGLPSPDAADPFGSVVPSQTGAPAAIAAPPSLLGAFAGGNAFITAFVLAEALAPPVALREKR